ncbi:uncharacterized protein J4E84_007475 [Alternaria hordeiaustralica]|uniref:uncharacterized protein n=1 Tax=Alternaria hordeiaustralica TaxID=1187925 RepID=UPI0020C22997|nr:uncharacterized protein J4E84_007475 [Alternaria hordeiaustralica]KAI4681878.1 hypothetical protein J4E84_007475 [Alternaria hordeiaustralica]
MQARQPPAASAGADHFARADKATIRDALTQVPDNEGGPWRDYDKVAHVGHKGIGRHPTTAELPQRKELVRKGDLAPEEEFWIKEARSKAAHDWDDDVKYVRNNWHENLAYPVQIILTKIGYSQMKRPVPEPDKQQWALTNIVNQTRTTIRKAVFMDLGTIFKAEGGKFEQAICTHLLARHVVVALLGRAKCDYPPDTRPLEIIFEDPYYSESDIKFIQEEFIIDPLVKVRASNDGSGWNETRVRFALDENAYAFVTFGMNTPPRQVLAGHTWGERAPYAAPGAAPADWLPPKRPSLVICRPWWEESGFDQSDSRVVDWLERYYDPWELLEGDVEGVGNSWAYVLHTSH